MNPTSANYSWSNTAQWSQVPSTPNDQTVQNQSYNSNYGVPSNNQVTQPNTYNPAPSSTEPRKDMITRLYKAILGREPDTAGLNYYLYNTHISELQIAQDMFESTEHTDILQKAKDVRQMVLKTEEITKKLNDMEYNLQSLQTLNENYKNLIDQKTQTINDLRGRLGLSNEYETATQTEHNQVHYSHPTFNQQQQFEQSQYQQSNQFENTDFLLDDPFAEDTNKSKPGCFGLLKSWFKFN